MMAVMMTIPKIIIAGSRHYNDYPRLKKALDYILVNIPRGEIVSGCSRGVDQMGEAYALERNWPIKYFPAEWTVYDEAAGPIRNEKMAKYADKAIVFTSGGKGSTSMINLSKKYDLDLVVVTLTYLGSWIEC